MRPPRPRYGWPAASFDVGDRVKGDSPKVPPRFRGRVTYVNRDGTLGITWDNGATSVNYPSEIKRDDIRRTST